MAKDTEEVKKEKEEELSDNQEYTEKNDESSENIEQKEEEQVQSEAQESESTAEKQSSDKVDELQKQIEDLKDKHLRLQAEYDNYRRRTLKEKADLIATAGEKLLVDLLPVVDDLDRAMDAVSTAQDVEAVKGGISLIVSKFQGFLTKNGVAEIEAKELPFDSEKHEAVTKFPAPTEDLKGKVVDVTKKGYTLNGKVIRYAQVVVGE